MTSQLTGPAPTRARARLLDGPAARAVEHPSHPGLPRAADRPAGPWAPYSPCGPACLPPEPRVAWPRVAARLLALAAVVAVAAVVVLALPVGAAFGAANRLPAAVCRATLRAAGIRLHVTGGDRYATGTGTLVVANHLSWIDVLALGAVEPLRMIAKREVRGWPVVGAVAARVGALFVDRSGLRALPALVAATADALRAGAVVGVFPEGTTWCGSASGPFRTAVFQAALDAGVPVRPVTIALRLPDGRPTTAAAFVGDGTLFGSLRRVLALDGLVCHVALRPALVPLPGEDRRTLACRAEGAVTAA